MMLTGYEITIIHQMTSTRNKPSTIAYGQYLSTAS